MGKRKTAADDAAHENTQVVASPAPAADVATAAPAGVEVATQTPDAAGAAPLATDAGGNANEAKPAAEELTSTAHELVKAIETSGRPFDADRVTAALNKMEIKGRLAIEELHQMSEATYPEDEDIEPNPLPDVVHLVTGAVLHRVTEGLPNTCSKSGQLVTGTWFASSVQAAIAGLGISEEALREIIAETDESARAKVALDESRLAAHLASVGGDVVQLAEHELVILARGLLDRFHVLPKSGGK